MIYLPVATRRSCFMCGDLTYVTRSAASCDLCYKEILSDKYTTKPLYKLLESENFAVNKLDAKRL